MFGWNKNKFFVKIFLEIILIFFKYGRNQKLSGGNLWGGQKEGSRIEYSVWLEKAAELLGEIEKIRCEIIRIAEDEPLAGTEFEAYQTLQEISGAIEETQEMLKKGGLDRWREKRLRNFVDQFEKIIEASEQLQKIKAFRGQTVALAEKVRALIILDRDTELDLKNRRGFADKNV